VNDLHHDGTVVIVALSVNRRALINCVCVYCKAGYRSLVESLAKLAFPTPELLTCSRPTVGGGGDAGDG
jgi:hypothetical protein